MAHAERALHADGRRAVPPRAHAGLRAAPAPRSRCFSACCRCTRTAAGPFARQTVYAARPDGSDRTTVDWPLGSVDVNTADAQALEALRGVGPALAQAIVDERTAAGPFDYPEDLTMGKGIGEKTLLKFYDQLDFSARAAGTVLP